MHTFENQLSLDFRTKQDNALLLYADDGGVQGNFYSLTIANGRLQLDFRLGDESNDLSSERPVITMRLNDIVVSDYRWHRLTLFQAWENVKLQLDDAVLFKILNQHSFVFGNLKTSSDIFIGGVPKDIHLLGVMSSPLKRHTRTFAGGVKNLLYRMYPQGVTSPQLIESVGMRQSDEDYCKPTNIAGTEDHFCRNSGICYSTNEGPKCDCSFTDFQGRRCEQRSLFSFSNMYCLLNWLEIKNYIHITLDDGAIIATSKFDGTEKRLIRMFSEYPAGRYDDDRWHTVTVVRTMTLNYIHITLDDGAIIATSKFDGTEKRLIRMFSEYPAGRYDDDRWHTVTVVRTMTLVSLFAACCTKGEKFSSETKKTF
ncbi:unnamed protein product [Gongylonema pulchrum]|uniref:LAM_G_DOMAIN domain-containing protein n=1 Tax=Gongylonema pulchrum TaxID=637853 RepID=A0A183DWB5_9BILA|nr:unnamed protein product [Gongylonema pulchrum]